MKTSEKSLTVLGALYKLQESVRVVGKNKKNDHFKSSYANLESVLEAIADSLKENNLLLTQDVFTNESGIDFVSTRFTHIAEGEWCEFGPVRVPTTNGNDPQKVKGGITYMKRTQLVSALALAEEDDDGNEAAGKGAKMPIIKKAGTRTTVADIVNSMQPKMYVIPDNPEPKPRVGGPTDKQLKRLFAIKKNALLSNDELKEMMKKMFNKESSHDLLQTEYKQLCDHLEALAVVAKDK